MVCYNGFVLILNENQQDGSHNERQYNMDGNLWEVYAKIIILETTEVTEQ